jgi:AraC-like DNA-binding protein
VFPARLLSTRLPGSDGEVRRALEHNLQTAENSVPPDLIEDLRQMLRTKLPRGRVSASDMARQLEMHKRTLNRYLKAAGTGFSRGRWGAVRSGAALGGRYGHPAGADLCRPRLLRTRRVHAGLREMVGGLAQPVAVTTESCLALSCGTYTAIADAGRQKERRLISARTKAALGAAPNGRRFRSPAS